jgi:hypothetical protein
LGAGNKSVKIIPPVTHSRLLDKARYVGAFMRLGPCNGRTLPQVAGNLDLLVQFMFLVSVKMCVFVL